MPQSSIFPFNVTTLYPYKLHIFLPIVKEVGERMNDSHQLRTITAEMMFCRSGGRVAAPRYVEVAAVFRLKTEPVNHFRYAPTAATNCKL